MYGQMYSIEDLRKVSKWTDDIKKDTRLFGVGTVNNQIHFQNGTRKELPFEDRSFSYELKENRVFAYGVLDGFNGCWSVDLLDQCFLTNIYFDNMQEKNLEDLTDEQIYEVLKEEFVKVEQTLEENLQDLLVKRAEKTLSKESYRRGTREYTEHIKDIKAIDEQIKSGAFAVVSLVVDDRLFVANVGTAHIFLCFYDKKSREKSIITLDTQHTLATFSELDRLAKLQANLQCGLPLPSSSATLTKEGDKGFDSVALDSSSIKYTRCLGDFKLKYYYHECPEFEYCTGPPIVCKADTPGSCLKIDDSFLFMAMYSDGFVKALEKTNLASDDSSATIAKMLIQKIISEQTLNSAAQSVLDEVKRAYDDKFANEHSEREDFTLGVRVFDTNIKSVLLQLEDQHHHRSMYSTCEGVSYVEGTLEELTGSDENEDESEDSGATLSSTVQGLHNSMPLEKKTSKRSVSRQDVPFQEFIDENDRVKPYVDFSELERLINLDENKSEIDEFVRQLEELAIETL